MTSTRILGAVSAFAALGAVFALQPGAATAQKFHMKIGMATVNDPQYEMGVAIGKELQKRSNGRLTFSVFPGSQLGKIPRQVEGVQLGTQEFFLTPPGFLTGLNAAFQVPDAPGMYNDIPHGHRALTHPAFRDKFLALAEKKGVLGTNLWLYDGTSYASHKPIRKPEDIKGMKIRVLATPMERAVPAVFGGTGVPIPYSEVVPALQKKVVDGARTSLVVMAASKFFTVVKNITVLNGGAIPTGTWLSKAWANKLPADLRKLVLTVPAELEDWGSKNAIARYKVSEQQWRDNGAEIIHFSPADHKRYMDAIRKVGVDYLTNHKNAEVREIYGLFKQAVAATR
jgi:TRAP-type C4-dicarboxylate transport system substrate-binding protein